MTTLALVTRMSGMMKPSHLVVLAEVDCFIQGLAVAEGGVLCMVCQAVHRDELRTRLAAQPLEAS